MSPDCDECLQGPPNVPALNRCLAPQWSLDTNPLSPEFAHSLVATRKAIYEKSVERRDLTKNLHLVLASALQDSGSIWKDWEYWVQVWGKLSDSALSESALPSSLLPPSSTSTRDSCVSGGVEESSEFLTLLPSPLLVLCLQPRSGDAQTRAFP